MRKKIHKFTHFHPNEEQMPGQNVHRYWMQKRTFLIHQYGRMSTTDMVLGVNDVCTIPCVKWFF